MKGRYLTDSGCAALGLHLDTVHVPHMRSVAENGVPAHGLVRAVGGITRSTLEPKSGRYGTVPYIITHIFIFCFLKGTVAPEQTDSQEQRDGVSYPY